MNRKFQICIATVICKRTESNQFIFVWVQIKEELLLFKCAPVSKEISGHCIKQVKKKKKFD
jgi:accessory gene regulator protein AgrB